MFVIFNLDTPLLLGPHDIRSAACLLSVLGQLVPLPASARLPNDGGNVLVVDDTVPLKVEWESDVAVRITGRLDTQIFKKEGSISGVQVAYVN